MGYTVYCHTNKVNGKKYIGITKNSPERRWQNGYGYKNNKHFFSAINKYGWDSFLHEIWYTNLTFDEACKIEREMIKKYDSTNPKNGYNVDSGGNGNESVSEAHRKAISNGRKGKPHPHKGRPLNGDKSPTFGTHRSEYVKQRSRESNSKPVICVETGIVYSSGLDACKKTGISNSCVSYSCKTAKPTKGFHFQFYLGGD